MRTSFLACLLCFTVYATAAVSVSAHEIPKDVVVNAFFKPKGNHALLLLRVPLEAMRDMEFPEREGFLDLTRVEYLLNDAANIWVAPFIEFYENGRPLPKPRIVATRVSLSSETAFDAYDHALRHVTGPKLPKDTAVIWNQVMLDVVFEYTIISDRAEFAVNPRLGRLGKRVETALQYLPSSGGVRAYRYEGDPGLMQLDPRWHQAAVQFLALGFKHILQGVDHLLFLLCLILPFRALKPLVVIVTSFTVAHSITLIAAANGWIPNVLWFTPLIETLIAASILVMAIENIIGQTALSRRWIAAFGFGLVHGFGFSFMLSDTLQFAGAQVTASLIAFNVGVEIGQILVVLLLIPLLELLFQRRPERVLSIIICAFVAHTAWHWMVDRGNSLSKFDYEWPDAALTAVILRAGAVTVLAIGFIWAGARVMGQWREALAVRLAKDSVPRR